MELQGLRAFLEIVNERSFTRASRNLHYSQSTVTARIKGLEDCLGVKLFHRRGRRTIELTSAGAELKPYAETILELVASAHQAVDAVTEQRGQACTWPQSGQLSSMSTKP